MEVITILVYMNPVNNFHWETCCPHLQTNYFILESKWTFVPNFKIFPRGIPERSRSKEWDRQPEGVRPGLSLAIPLNTGRKGVWIGPKLQEMKSLWFWSRLLRAERATEVSWGKGWRLMIERQKGRNRGGAITDMLLSLSKSFMCAGRRLSLVKMTQRVDGDWAL